MLENGGRDMKGLYDSTNRVKILNIPSSSRKPTGDCCFFRCCVLGCLGLIWTDHVCFEFSSNLRPYKDKM